MSSKSTFIEDIYFEETKNIITKGKLLSELAKRQYDNPDSDYSKRAHFIACKKLLRILNKKNKNSPQIFLSNTEREHLNYACTFVKTLMDFKFNYKYFYKHLCSDSSFPLEFIYQLHLLGILPLNSYILQIRYEPKIISNFCKSVVFLLVNQISESGSERYLISGLFLFILNKVFVNEIKDTHIHKIFKLILKVSVKKLLEMENLHSEKTISFLFVWDISNVDNSVLKLFSIYVLKLIVFHKPYIDITQAVADHRHWIYNPNNPTSISAMCEKILVVLDSDEVLSLFNYILSSENHNWKNFFLILSQYLKFNKDGLLNVTTWTDKFLTEAFEKSDEQILIRAFLIQRHATLLDHCHIPLAYSNWFQKNFNGTATITNDVTSFEFLLTVLTNLVPFEPEEYLKIHIEKTLLVPSESKQQYIDYVTLVKTRLSELKPQTSPETVMKKMLVFFENTGKLPSAILEKSILQKHEYENKFLPNLLKPRKLPSVPDTKMKFLLALNALGKIPKEMFEKYEFDCNAFTEQDIGVEPMDIESQTVNNQIADLSLSFIFQIQDCDKDMNLIKRCLSEFRQQLFLVLKDIHKPNCSSPIVIENLTFASDLKDALLEIVQCYCNFHVEVMNCQWDLTADLKNFKNLHDVLYIILYEKILNDETEISIASLATLLAQISFLSSDYPLVKVSALEEPVHLSEWILTAFPITTSSKMDYFYKLAFIYLKMVFNHLHSLSVSTNLIKKFHYASIRIQFQNVMIWNHALDPVAELCQSTVFQNMISNNQLTFSEWLLYESQMIFEEDNIKGQERYQYNKWCIQHLFNFSQKTSSNSSLKLWIQELFQLLLKKYDSCPCFDNMLLLLKELLEIAQSVSEDVGVNKLWIYESFYFILNSYKDCAMYELRKQILVQRFTRLICDLPAYILFHNFSSTSVPDLLQLQYFIENYLKCFYNKQLGFSFQMTCHIFKGLASLLLPCANENVFEKNNTLIKNFLSHTPILKVSIISHWTVLKQLLCINLLKKHSYLHILCEEYNTADDLSNRLMHGEPIFTFTTIEMDDWSLGFIIAIKDCNLNLLTESKAISFEVLGSAIHFHIVLGLIRKYNNKLIEKVKEPISWLFQHKQEKYFDPQYYSNTAFKAVLSSSLWYHFPALFLLTLVSVFNVKDLRRIDKQMVVSWICILLKTLNKCNKNYNKKTMLPFYYSSNDCGRMQKESYGILNLAFIQTMTEKIKIILQSIPISFIQQIPKEIVECCDEYLKCFLN